MAISYISILSAVAAIFLYLAAGSVMRKVGWLHPLADQTIMKLVVNFMYPCLIFVSLLGVEALKDVGNLTIAPLFGFITIVLGFGLAWLVGGFFGLAVGKGKRAFSLTVGIFNYGYLPIPIIMQLFDENTLGLLLLFNLGVEIAVWTVGILIISGAGFKDSWKRILNPPVIALLLGIFFNLTNLDQHVPVFAVAFCEGLGNASIPLALILAGATLADFIADTRWRQAWLVVSGACALRLLLLPLIFVGLAVFLPLSYELKVVLIVQAAMPAGIFPLVIVKHFGGDVNVALQVILGTSLFGLFLIPLWIQQGLSLIGP